jgi:hypothetical protein
MRLIKLSLIYISESPQRNIASSLRNIQVGENTSSGDSQ